MTNGSYLRKYFVKELKCANPLKILFIFVTPDFISG